jgi:hypothetical protein
LNSSLLSCIAYIALLLVEGIGWQAWVTFDGWGKAAVQTLSIYYAADTSQSDVEMLGYRAAFLWVFDWANGAIDNAASASDLHSFYASGAGRGGCRLPPIHRVESSAGERAAIRSV